MVGASMKEVITAIVLAYEFEQRLCLFASTGVRERKWHHATLTQFVSPIVAGKMLGLNVDQMVNAIGISGSHNHTIGCRQQVNSHEKTLSIRWQYKLEFSALWQERLQEPAVLKVKRIMDFFGYNAVKKSRSGGADGDTIETNLEKLIGGFGDLQLNADESFSNRSINSYSSICNFKRSYKKQHHLRSD
jgi:hypothetical protein